MSRKTRYQIKNKQKLKRKKKRQKLASQNMNPNDYYQSGFRVKAR